MDIKTIEKKRDDILGAMRAIRSMRPGTVSEQYLKVRHQGKRDPVRRGPYFLWQYYEGGKPVRKRLTSDENVQTAREEVANRKRFGELCEEFVRLTQRLGELEREAAASEEAVKKGLKSRLRRAGKSRG